ncbi:MAG: hypothetical protein HC853_09245 [Anaerolineae bacterium]|nr:hypothetical protein [Anaerolineae bacterium]
MDCQEHLGQNGYTSGPCPMCGLEETRVFVDELQVGETIVVKPGERIAMDGCITHGSSTVNQAPTHSGESVPVDPAQPGQSGPRRWLHPSPRRSCFRSMTRPRF